MACRYNSFIFLIIFASNVRKLLIFSRKKVISRRGYKNINLGTNMLLAHSLASGVHCGGDMGFINNNNMINTYYIYFYFIDSHCETKISTRRGDDRIICVNSIVG